MKKNSDRKAKRVNQRIGKYRTGQLVFNLLSFFAVFVMMGIVAFVTISVRSFYSAREVMLEYIGSIGSSKHTEGDLKKSPDARMTVAYYMGETPIVGGIYVPNLNPNKLVIAGVLESDAITKLSKIKSEKFNTFIREDISGHTYLTYATKTTYAEYTIDGESKVIIYAKVYMNVDGEISSQRELMTTYFMCVISILIFGIMASYSLMRRSVKPLGEFVHKQLTFVSDASHELRTPLAIVQSKLENILAEPDMTIYDVSEDLAISLKEISRLTKLTTDLLELARSDKEQILLNLEIVNLNELIKEFTEPFIEIAELENRFLSYDGEDVEARVDPDKIRQIMIIILDNSLKYTNEGDSIFVSVTSENGEATIKVIDTGIGISEKTKNQIFERFYREDKTRSRDTGGNGLGLSIAKTLVNVQKGRIYVEHNTPKGMIIVMSFPKTK